VTALVILPTFNERENLPVVVDRITALGLDVEVLVIDDSSPDGTGDVADDLARRLDVLRVVHRPAQSGLGTAIVRGLKDAIDNGYEYAVVMDADLSHLPEDLPALLEAAESCDVAVGSRYTAGGRIVGWPASRKAASFLTNLFARVALGLPLADATGGYRVYRTSALRRLDLDGAISRDYSIQEELLLRCRQKGLHLREVPITFVDRERGASKASFSVAFRSAATLAYLALLRLKGGTWRKNRKK